MPKLTYKDDHDSGLIEMFVDGKLLTTWSYEDEAELAFIEFTKIFEKGQEEAIAHFGCYLIDHHEDKFDGGENEIQQVSIDALQSLNESQL